MGNAREEAFAAIAESFAREEKRWRRDNPGKVRFYLSHAPDEPPTFSVAGQAALREVVLALHDHHIDADTPIMALDSVDAVDGYTGEIVVLIKAVTRPLIAILAAWVAIRKGRKVRFKQGDIEIEAGTAEEAERLLGRVQALQTNQKSSEEKNT